MRKAASHKQVGVYLDEQLRWKEQEIYAAAKASRWVSKLQSLTRGNSGIPSRYVRQLYQAVGVAQFQYASHVWYMTPHLPAGAKKKRGSVHATAKLATVQQAVTCAITGTMKTTATDVLDLRANTLPGDLALDKANFNTAVRLCTLLLSHPLHNMVWQAADELSNGRLPSHPSPLHHLLKSAGLAPDDIETVSPPTRRPHLPFGFQTRTHCGKTLFSSPLEARTYFYILTGRVTRVGSELLLS